MSRERAWATRTRTATMRTAPIQIRKARGLIIVLAVPSIDSRRLRGARRAWSRRASEQFADLLGGLRLVHEVYLRKVVAKGGVGELRFASTSPTCPLLTPLGL